MPEEKEFNELIYAYTLGCLDDDDKQKLKSYFESGGNYPWLELGEYQNLVALLPSILNIETPGSQLKDKVARKLYRIRDEKRTGQVNTEFETNAEVQKDKSRLSVLFEEKDAITSEPETFHEEEPEENNESRDVVEEKMIETKKLRTTTEEFEVVNPARSITSDFRPPQEKEIKMPSLPEEETENDAEEEQPESIKEVAKSKSIDKKGLKKSVNKTKDKAPKEKAVHSKTFAIILWVLLFIIAAAGITLVYLKFSKEVNVYKDKVAALNKQISGLSSQLNNNQQLQNILMSKNVVVASLQGTDLTPGGFGKLIIDTDNNKAFIQLANMPNLAADETFHLWVNTTGNYMPLGVFKIVSDQQYYSFTMPEINKLQSAKFIVTEQPAGADKPSKRIVLMGSIQ
jgi:Anti-sigma-K factor rskA, C-terminal